MMEWTGQQQLSFLLQSTVFGFLQGLLLDVLSNVRARSHRRWLWSDVLFGPIAGVMTFLGALVIMDGQLHPILFVGVFAGMALEHRMVGVWIGWLMRNVRTLFRKATVILDTFLCCLGSKRKNNVKMPEKGEKRQKMSCFFRKKT